MITATRPELAETDNDRFWNPRMTRNEVIEANIPLIRKFALNATRNGLSEYYWDAVNEGAIAVSDAFDRFDPSLGHKFSTYASHMIWGYIDMALKNQKGIIRVPPNVQHVANRRNKGVAIDELAEAQARLVDAVRVGFLGDTLAMVVSPRTPIETASTEDADTANHLLDLLGKREKVIVKLYYGIEADGREHTLQEIGDFLGISRERVNQIRRNAIAKMQERAERMSRREERNT